MMIKISRPNASNFNGLNDLKRKKETIKGNRGEPTKDPPTVKLVFSLGLKYSEWMNS